MSYHARILTSIKRKLIINYRNITLLISEFFYVFSWNVLLEWSYSMFILCRIFVSSWRFIWKRLMWIWTFSSCCYCFLLVIVCMLYLWKISTWLSPGKYGVIDEKILQPQSVDKFDFEWSLCQSVIIRVFRMWWGKFIIIIINLMPWSWLMRLSECLVIITGWETAIRE